MGEGSVTQANIQVAGAKLSPPPVQTNTEEVSQVSGKLAAERADAPTNINFAGNSSATQIEFTPAQAAFANSAWLNSTSAQLA